MRSGALLAANAIDRSGSARVRWSPIAAACAVAAVAVAGPSNWARNIDPPRSTAIAAADGEVAAIAPRRVNRVDIIASAGGGPETAKSMSPRCQRARTPENTHPPLPATANAPNRSRGRGDDRVASQHIASVRGKVRARQDAARSRPVPARLSGHASTRALVRTYHQVGEAIGRLEIAGDRHVVRDLRNRYFRLRYSVALRDASVRRETLAALATLQRELQRASTRSPPLAAAADR